MATPELLVEPGLGQEEAARARRLAWLARRNPGGILGAALVAIVGPLAWRTSPTSQDYERLLGPSLAHPFGTDDLGRDTLARVMHGAQVSLEVGVVSVAVSLVLGTLIGTFAGYY